MWAGRLCLMNPGSVPGLRLILAPLFILVSAISFYVMKHLLLLEGVMIFSSSSSPILLPAPLRKVHIVYMLTMIWHIGMELTRMGYLTKRRPLKF